MPIIESFQIQVCEVTTVVYTKYTYRKVNSNLTIQKSKSCFTLWKRLKNMEVIHLALPNRGQNSPLTTDVIEKDGENDSGAPAKNVSIQL